MCVNSQWHYVKAPGVLRDGDALDGLCQGAVLWCSSGTRDIRCGRLDLLAGIEESTGECVQHPRSAREAANCRGIKRV